MSSKSVLASDTVHITVDVNNNLVLTDVTGSFTLSMLTSYRNIWINTTHLPGNFALSDATNWGTTYSYISGVKVMTVSTNWDLWIFEDNTYGTASITSRKIAEGVNGNFDITLMREYNSIDTNVYLTYTDFSPGGSTASFYITGKAQFL